MANIKTEKIQIHNHEHEIRTYQEIFIKTVDDNEYVIGWFMKDNSKYERPFLEFLECLNKRIKNDDLFPIKNIYRRYVVLRPSQIVEIIEGDLLTGEKKEVLEHLQEKHKNDAPNGYLEWYNRRGKSKWNY